MTIFLWIVFGLVMVSAGEYVAHRWLMHREGIDAFYFPHSLHHNRYYRVFNQEDHPIGRELNLRITWSDTAIACGLASPLAFVSMTGYAILVGLAVLHRYVWNVIHTEMHLNRGRWFSKCRLYLYLQKHHFLHHRHQNKNFNVTLPLFDVLLRTQAQWTPADAHEWSKLTPS